MMIPIKKHFKYICFMLFHFLLLISLYKCKNNIKSVEQAQTKTEQDIQQDSVSEDLSVSEPVNIEKETMQSGKDTIIAVKVPEFKPLTVIITNLESPTAPVTMSAYGPHNKFPDRSDQLRTYILKPKNCTTLKAKLTGMKYGELAMAIYQDVNNNGHIDQDFLGIPKEPYGFSNDIKPKVKAPSFEDCKFSYNEKSNTITMKMIR